MTVRCAHCGEELLGAVNRCWKCGQQFVARPTVDGLPPVRIESLATAAVGVAAQATEALEATVLDDAGAAQAATETEILVVSPAPPETSETAAVAASTPPGPPVPQMPLPPPSIFPPPPNPLATPAPLAIPMPQRYVPPRPNIAALGGAYGAVVLGVFAVALAYFRWEAAIVAVVGLLMGIWGIYSPRRGWALVGMLLFALAMGLGTFTGVRELYLYLNRYAPISIEEPVEEDVAVP